MNKDILNRFFEGRSNRWEKKQVQEYLDGNEMDIIDQYLKEQAGPDTEDIADPAYKDSFFKALTARIEQQDVPATHAGKSLFLPVLKIAASIILICTVGSLLYINKQKELVTEIKARIARISNNGRNLKMLELEDGTKIWMNPGTTIVYNKSSYGDTAREISLTGEAYFNVSHNPKKPFRVKTGQLTTTVLGTSFNVEAYENEQDMRVTLVTGSVKVDAGNSKKVLRPGEMLDFSKQHHTAKILAVDVSDKQKLYTEGRLIFENLPLKEVLKRLERVFGLEISISDQDLLKNKRITGAYYRDNAEQALTRILFIHGLHHHRKGENNYVIEQ